MAFTMHSHSGQFCPGHAKDQLEDIIRHAISMGYKTMGLTEHMPRLQVSDLYPEELTGDPDEAVAVLTPRHGAYLIEAQRLQAKYAPQIHVLIGFEGEWYRPAYGPYITTLAAHPAVDYFIGSIHHVNAIPIDYDAATYAQARESSGGTEERMYERYYDQQHEMLTALRPRVVGHFDLIRLLSEDPGRDVSAWAGVWQRIVRNLELVRSFDGLLECNSAALRKGLAEPYPNRLISEKWLSMGGRFTFSDDSHGIDQVATNYLRNIDYLESLGVSTVYTLERLTPAASSTAGTKATVAEKPLYVYPIKGLRAIPLTTATFTRQGISHDRTFMLLKVLESGSLKRMQLSDFPACALFEQELVDDTIRVRYHVPEVPLAPDHPLQHQPLSVPLTPEDLASLDEVDVDLHNSPVRARRVGDAQDAWFSACFGFPTTLVYIGDGRRAVVGPNFLPPGSGSGAPTKPSTGWLSSVSSYVTSFTQPTAPADEEEQNDVWLTFTDCAPFLVTSEASLAAVSARLPPVAPAEMIKFRPNVVVDADGAGAWDEDFWAELGLPGDRRLQLTANCGEAGTVLKKLMKDRRVDKGSRWSPVFGRYAFLAGRDPLVVRVGDEVGVVRRNEERSVYDWPMHSKPPVKRPA
ncbi:hypothetical protein BN1708_004489 [Verticillium longisporum]|uniref:histidinol-phosphatase n=1 Tax=Verticillium longisporum TaxID=100787 RepID=A0A0G4M0M1_VERLO|nr:hypothetical protein BN1708_004489 [Verticillium longisporum]